MAGFPSPVPAGPVAGRPRVVVIGAGAIGLAIAWRLAASGCPVVVVERGAAGSGASRAAAGMLAAAFEAEPGEERLLGLTLRSQALWPAFARELEAAAGEPIGYREEGTLAVALTRDDAEQLRSGIEWRRRVGLAPHWLTGAAAREREPALTPGTVAAAFFAEDRQVESRRLVAALKAALLACGGRLWENCPACLDVAGGRLAGVAAGDRRLAADLVVLAAGAWSAAVEGLPAAARPPVRPVKGQMLALRMPERHLLRHVVAGPQVYLLPRRDGRLVIGATTEERGFDGALTAGGVYGLLDGAWRLLPAIEDLAIDEMWTGFRPGSPDDAPILGPSPVEGLVLATGHHRMGILLTPATSAAIAAYVETGALPEWSRGFGLDRFAAAPVMAAAREDRR
jgi:glycine oxidase